MNKMHVCFIIVYKYFLQFDCLQTLSLLSRIRIGIINMKLFEGKAWSCSTLQTTPIAYEFDHILNFGVRNHFRCHDEFIPFFFIG